MTGVSPKAFDPARDDASFTLAMADATAALVVPALLAPLQLEAGGLALRFVPLPTRDPRALLERGDADLALGFFPDLEPLLAPDERAARLWHAERLWRTEYVCVMRQGHPLAAPGALTLDSTVNQFHSAASVVRQTDLLTVLPKSFVPAAGFDGELTHRELPFAVRGIAIDLVWHRRHDDVPAQRWLRQSLRDVASRMAGNAAG